MPENKQTRKPVPLLLDVVVQEFDDGTQSTPVTMTTVNGACVWVGLSLTLVGALSYAFDKFRYSRSSK